MIGGKHVYVDTTSGQRKLPVALICLGGPGGCADKGLASQDLRRRPSSAAVTPPGGQSSDGVSTPVGWLALSKAHPMFTVDAVSSES